MLIWRRDIGQCQTNVETILCTSTMKFTTLTNVESACYFSVDINNVGQHRITLSFPKSSFATLISVARRFSVSKYAKCWKIKLEWRTWTIIFFWASNKNHLKLNTLNSKFRLLLKNLVLFVSDFRPENF